MTKVEVTGPTWGVFALFAFAGYLVKGRGAVVVDSLAAISPTLDSPDAARYLTSDELAAEEWLSPGALEAARALIGTYDPGTQLPLVERKTDGLTNVHFIEGEPGWSPRETYDFITNQRMPAPDAFAYATKRLRDGR